MVEKSWEFFKNPAAPNLEENLLIIYGSQRKGLFLSELSEDDKIGEDSHKHITQIKIRLKSNKNAIFVSSI